MKHKNKSLRSSFSGSKTWRRYLVSYMATLLFMLFGFLFLIQFPLTRSYRENLLEQTGEYLDSLGAQIDSVLTGIVQTDQSITGNINLILPSYNNSSWSEYEAFNALQNYAVGNPYIHSIVLFNQNNMQTISTGVLVTWDEQTQSFTLRSDSRAASFPGSILQDPSSSLFFTRDNTGRVYLLFAPVSTADSIRVFYVLDTNELSTLLHTVVGGEIVDTLLLSPEGECIVSASGSFDASFEKAWPDEAAEGNFPLDNGHSLSWQSLSLSGCKVAAEISEDFYRESIRRSFHNTYLLLLFIGVVGFAISFLAMRSTLRPLQDLTKKIAPVSTVSDNYLEQIDRAFTDSADQNQQLQSKISHYRHLMQNNILSSISSVFPESDLSAKGSDAFFSADPDNQLYAIFVLTSDRTLLGSVVERLHSSLPAESVCVVMIQNESSFTLVLNYPGPELQKDDILHMICEEINEDLNVPVASSDGSSSPLDIPTLCDQAALAGSCLSENQQVLTYRECASLPAARQVRTYPHEQINALQQSLDSHQFTAAQAVIEELFTQLGDSAPRNSVPDYYVHCVLFDILGALIRSMGEADVKYRLYSDVYMETLYYCQSFPFAEKSDDIHENINRLLAIYQEDLENRTINIEKIREVIEENYCSPDFSITVLADRFGVSIAYMSFVFKKETGQKFSDYLWQLRLEKAQRLLTQTDMTIDAISEEVGYLNTSSFRRKFKQETGLSPNQYRAEASR